MSNCFTSADILLPQGTDLSRWAVIACDQYTSQPEYWREAHRLTEGSPSALDLILPEAELDAADTAERIEKIHTAMLHALRESVFQEYRNCFIYTERRMKNGKVRRGIVGKIDLWDYDYSGTENASVRATEKTVTERIPPRVAVRRGAALELPHILMLCNDDRRRVIEPLAMRKAALRKLYDVELMLGGGHAEGWLIDGEEKRLLEERIGEYEAYERAKHPGCRMAYAVGDGNHSLASAKACSQDTAAARYALVELNNIHDGEGDFEPIHRLVKHCDVKKLLADAGRLADVPDGVPVPWISADGEEMLRVPAQGGKLPLAALQEFLDGWLSENRGELDYIHGGDTLRILAKTEGCLGFLLPPVPKEGLFPGILSDGVLPRKTFSMGEAAEKRYYLEARRISD